MTIKRDDLGKTGFKDVATGKRLAPVHPGGVLMRDVVEPLGGLIWRAPIFKPASVLSRKSCLVRRRHEHAPSLDQIERLSLTLRVRPFLAFLELNRETV